MKEIVVISGKGGTGKTSITACFAHLAESAVFADCDVDAADLHLLLSPKIRESGEFRAGKVASIDPQKCTGCGICFERCKFGAINRDDLVCTIDEISCEGCGVCKIVCPSGAVDIREKESGRWIIADSKKHPFVYAHLHPGEENSGKLVSLVRVKAKEYAEKNGIDIIIVDGPPGIGCPVIASMGGVDLAVVVTEPTQSGMHDMVRVLKLSEHFKVPACICINKYDLNFDMTKKIEDFCKEKDIPLVGKIPFEIMVTKAMLDGKSLVEFCNCEASDCIRGIWGYVRKF